MSTKQETTHTHSAKVSTCYTLWHFGDWSLITGKGGLQNGRGRKWSFTPTKEGGSGKRFSCAEGGWGHKVMGGGEKTLVYNTSFEVVLTWELEVLAKVMGYMGVKGPLIWKL